MATPSLREKSLILLLCGALTTPAWAAAVAPQSSGAPKPSAPVSMALFGRAWSFLKDLSGGLGCLLYPTSSQCVADAKSVSEPKTGTDEGCNIDPSGRTHCVANLPQAPRFTATGVNIDPDGVAR